MKSAELKLAYVNEAIKQFKKQIKFNEKQEQKYKKVGNKDLEFTSKMVKDAYSFVVHILERGLGDN